MANERPVMESPWLHVALADVTKPSGQTEAHYFVRLPPAAVVVALNRSGTQVLLTWRHRVVPDVSNYELPGGLIDDGETPAQAAQRELVEETGYRARQLQHLLTYEPAVGSIASPHHVFVARGLEPTSTGPTEPDEGVFGWVALDDVPALISSGRVVNAGTLIGLLHLRTVSHAGGLSGDSAQYGR